MVEYGALFDGSFAQQLHQIWLDICSFLSGVSIYWEIFALVIFIVLIRWLIGK